MEWLALGIMAIAGAMTTAMNYNSVKRTNAVNLQNAREQRDFEKEQIQQQNEYNTPANQMDRFLEAGLNPNLIYSQGNAGNQSGIASYTPAHFDAPKLDTAFGINDAIGQAIHIAEFKADKAVKDSTVAVNNQRAKNIAADTLNKAAANGYLQDRSELYGTYMRNILDTQREDITRKEFQNAEYWGIADAYKTDHNLPNMDASTAYGKAKGSEWRVQLENIRSIADVNKFNADLKNKGILPGSNLYQTLIQLAINRVLGFFGDSNRSILDY